MQQFTGSEAEVDLSLATRAEGARTVVEVGGEIDAFAAPKLRDKLDQLIEAGNHQLVVDLERELPPIDVAGCRTVKVEGPRQWLAFPAGASAAPLVAEVAERWPLVDLSVREPDIEDVIARMYA